MNYEARMKNWIMPYIIALIAISIVILLYKDTNTLYRNHYDDAEISYRYAANLASGNGLVFNPGERTDAASSFLYTAILATFYRFGWHDLEMVSFLLNMLAVGVISAMVYLCAFRLSKNRWWSAALGLIAGTHGFISGWACLGMDTVPFSAMLCALAWAFIEKQRILADILVCLLIIMRIEGILIVPFYFYWTYTNRGVKS